MNTKHLILLSSICLTFLSSCAGSGPSIAQLGAGSDAAYLNGTRGRPEAQISEQQARQFDRQRDQVAKEMALEHQKRMHTLETVGAFVQIIGGFAGYVR